LKKPFIVFIIFCCLFCKAFSQQNYWQQQVDYKIDVKLNDVDNTLDGNVKMDYYNNSPDTLHFIWILLWANAFKNDRTAFSDQLLENGRTDFYFSNDDQRGYINRLEFRVNGVIAETEDHPQHQDIIKLILPQPLAPNSNIKIETPFHIKLPYNFSGDGYQGHSYQITQWYPKPAVYDSKGWHDIPYLTQGGSYNELGNYEVQITLPANYAVAATGDIQSASEIEWLTTHSSPLTKQDTTIKYVEGKKKISVKTITPSSPKSKTIIYRQNNTNDFVWFADKQFLVKHDTIQSLSGKIINAFIYYTPANKSKWENSIQYIKDAINTKTKLIGEYPYNTISIAENTCKHNEARAFPGVAILKPSGNENTMDFLITHLTGYNWFGAALANNERDNPWMNKGMNGFYDDKHLQAKDETVLQLMDVKSELLKNRLPDDPIKTILETHIGIKQDQPIATKADSFSLYNYYLISFVKTAEWMKLLADNYNDDAFTNAMKEYYKQWQFKHPYPEDFKKSMEDNKKNTDSIFSLLDTKGSIASPVTKKKIKFYPLFNFKQTDKYNYIFAAPALGYNIYDKLMIGIVLHNYTLPLPKFQFLLSPLYATGSKQLNGLGRLSYSWYPGNNGEKVELSLSGETFSSNAYPDSTGKMQYFRFSKILPSIKLVFGNKDPRSSTTQFVQWKTFFINDQFINTDFPSTSAHYINQLRYVVDNSRVLYPYHGELQIDQGDGFARAVFTGNYYFNYVKGGGLNFRIFAGKFFYLGEQTIDKEINTEPYQLNMSGPVGYEDYTYSNYFLGRNAFDKISSQQIMMRDGFFKIPTTLQGIEIGKTDNWLAAANFTTDIPRSINPLSVLPIKIPLKAFLDVGTSGRYSLDYTSNSTTPLQFLYDAGLQLSLFKNILNIYLPLFYSDVYKNYLQTDLTGNKFWQSISFSIDIQNIQLKKLAPQVSL